MGKRGVIRQLLSWRQQATRRGAGSNLPRGLETLEGRQLLTAATAPIVDAVWQGQNIQVVQGEYVIELKTGANLDKLVKESNFQNVTPIGSGGFYSLSSDKSIAQMEKWASNRTKTVVAMTPNVVTRIADLTLPNDTYIGDLWQYNNTGQLVPDPQFDPTGDIAWSTNNSHVPEAGTPGADISAAEAWSIVQGDANTNDPSKQIVVAVLDTGIDLTHPDLVDNIWANPGEIADNGIDDDGDGFIDDVHGWNFVSGTNDVMDDNSHGTHVSGIIGATGNNSTGVSGVIQQVKILPVKVGNSQGRLTTADIVAGIEYVTMLKNQGVNIVVANGSFGGTVFPLNRVENDAVSRMGQADVLFVVAAGNDAANVDPGQSFPAKFSLNQPNVITVAATDDQDNIAFFSNIGATSVQIAAPGVNILSTFPTYDVGTLLETGELVPSVLNNYGYDSGTSMASPMVAGAIALMKAAKPDASMMELKTALLDGADYIPALDKSVTSGTPLVSTAGRLNVYKAILNLLNQQTNVDKSTRGNWSGVYGSEAAVVYGETGADGDFANSVVTARVSNASLQVIADTSKDVDALQQQFDPSSRIASQLVSAGPITLDLEFNDGKSHRVSLYQADLTNAKKAQSQTITLVDPDSGTIFASYTTGDLATGEYDTFEVNPPSTLAAGATYRVQIVITPSSGGKAVLNGLFVDPATTADSSLVTASPVAGVTKATGGNWRQQYGSEGAAVFGKGGGSNLSAPLTITGGTTVTKAKFKSNAAALLVAKAKNEKQRIGGYVQTAKSMDFRIDLSSFSTPQQLTLYAADFEKLGRAQRVDLYDDTTGALLSSVDMTNFASGKYVSWEVSGKVRIHVTKLAGSTAVVSGIFLDAAPGAAIQYDGMDVTTAGNWRTFYGGDAAFVIGSSSAPVPQNVYSSNLAGGSTLAPANEKTQSVTVTFTNAGNNPPHTVTTSDSRFLLTTAAGSTQRVSNAKSTGNSMNIDIKFTDQDTHTVAIYVVDPDKKNSRAERLDLQLIDPVTGKITTIASQLVTNFSKGKYVVFDTHQIDASASFDVRVHVSRVTGQTAVVNGVFFG